MQPAPVAFKMVKSLNSDVFVQQVNALLKEGWVFHGPMMQSGQEWVQGMVQIEIQPIKMGSAFESSIMPVGGSPIFGGR